MKGRKTKRAAAAALLLLSIASMALWIRSTRSADLLVYNGPGLGASAMVVRGTLWITAGRSAPGPTWTHYAWAEDQIEISDSQSFACIGWSTGAGWFPLGLPLWVLTLASGYIAYRLNARRVIPGNCTRCGYDMRATPDRCPECGTASLPAS